ncbi:MAG: hypothetical protein NWF04_08925 [Candidatus Bathyarchaeota archaeon]|nr:hypothetical protein [Candidatus Bathyarchaeota archaeon]
MYDELYAAWRIEVEDTELDSLPCDFYTRLADYLRRIKEELQLTDQKGIKTRLLDHELENAQSMAQELILTRYRKIIKRLAAGKKIPPDSLPTQEAQLCNGITPCACEYNKFAATILKGHLTKLSAKPAQQEEPQATSNRVLLRFVKPVPTIIGSDMKSYGPFIAEDVAAVPKENAKILVKRGLAKPVEHA